MRYTVSAFADEAADNLLEQIGACKKNNIEFIELRGVGGKNVSVLTLEEVKEIKKTLDDNGIKLSAIGSPYGKINILDDFAPHLEQYKRTIEAAHVLGTENIRLFSFYMPKNGRRADYRQQVIDRLGAFIDNADGIRVCHENESDIFGEDAEHCLDLCNAFPGKLMHIFDPANFIMCGVDSLQAYKLLKPHIVYFHIKDAIAKEKKIVPAGYGDGEIGKILCDFAAEGKDAFVTLEPHLAVFTGLDEMSKTTAGTMTFSYQSRGEAFDAAAAALRDVLSKNNL